MTTCSQTSNEGFPHHWKCIETDGHIGCSCDGNGEYCEAYECTLADGSHRCPDGSIAAKAHLEKRGIAVGVRRLGAGPGANKQKIMIGISENPISENRTK